MPVLETRYAEELCRVSKIITDDIEWRPRGNRWRLEARVLAPSLNEVLSLSGNIGKTNHGFTLLFGGEVIRRYDHTYTPHINPDGSKIRQPHKHSYDRMDGNQWVYVPNDIDPDESINNQLMQFLDEANIRLEGQYRLLLIERLP